MRSFTLLSLLSLAGLTACSATTHPPKSIYVVTDVTVIDVEKGITVPSQTVIVVNDRIDKIGAQGKVEIPKGAVIKKGVLL